MVLSVAALPGAVFQRRLRDWGGGLRGGGVQKEPGAVWETAEERGPGDEERGSAGAVRCARFAEPGGVPLRRIQRLNERGRRSRPQAQAPKGKRTVRVRHVLFLPESQTERIGGMRHSRLP
jgi:hypothetical protein